MKYFAQLIRELDRTTKTNEKINALVKYFNSASEEDKTRAIAFLTGNRPPRAVNLTKVQQWAAETAGIPGWLFDECYESVGDLAETISLLVSNPDSESDKPLSWYIHHRLLQLKNMNEAEQKETMIKTWKELNQVECFVWNKLSTGGFRIGVSKQIVIIAFARYSDVDAKTIAHRLMGYWKSGENFYKRLVSDKKENEDSSKPYPFYLASQLDMKPEDLGEIAEWHIEWKWDGIRAQLIKRENEIFIWSRGNELINDRFPELLDASVFLPDGIAIDGEILAFKEKLPLPFAELQKRIGRKHVTKKILTEAPAAFICFDLLEYNNEDIRMSPLEERINLLGKVLGKETSDKLILSVPVEPKDWNELRKIRDESRKRKVEGMMLKRKNSVYKVGRKRGDWCKWKIDPLVIDAVLIYAQKGHGRRAGLYTDYTFAVWKDKALVPFAKAYSGLTDEEIRKVDNFVKDNTVEKFGPVRSVKPQLVFELAFEGIQKSTRHKSGVAVRFPRINRWRHDLKIEDAGSIKSILEMISLI
jgi:DNA ligase-1